MPGVDATHGRRTRAPGRLNMTRFGRFWALLRGPQSPRLAIRRGCGTSALMEGQMQMATDRAIPDPTSDTKLFRSDPLQVGLGPPERNSLRPPQIERLANR